MRLADADDGPESLGILITRAEGEFPNGMTGDGYTAKYIWIDGEQNGKCLVLKWISAYNFDKAYVSCSQTNFAYCEFKSEQIFFKFCDNFFVQFQNNS
jgi:hypothetical protein